MASNEEQVICEGCYHRPLILATSWTGHNKAAHDDKATYRRTFDVERCYEAVEAHFYFTAPDDVTLSVKRVGTNLNCLQCDWTWFDPVKRRTHTGQHVIDLPNCGTDPTGVCACTGTTLAEQAKRARREELIKSHTWSASRCPD